MSAQRPSPFQRNPRALPAEGYCNAMPHENVEIARSMPIYTDRAEALEAAGLSD